MSGDRQRVATRTAAIMFVICDELIDGFELVTLSDVVQPLRRCLDVVVPAPAFVPV